MTDSGESKPVTVKTIPDYDDLVSQVRSIVGAYIDALKDPRRGNLKLDSAIYESAIKQCIQRYRIYLEEYSLSIRIIDYYKIIAWMPYGICDVCRDEFGVECTPKLQNTLLAYAIGYLEGLLESEGRRFESDDTKDAWLRTLKNIARNGFRDDMDDVSIQSNGLYVAFKSASRVLISNPEQPTPQTAKTKLGVELSEAEEKLKRAKDGYETVAWYADGLVKFIHFLYLILNSLIK